MKKISILIFILINIFPYFLKAQTLYVKYKFDNSEVSSRNEQLFVKNNNFYNVVDSNIFFKSESSNTVFAGKNEILKKEYIYRNSKNYKIIIDKYLSNRNYIIEDNVPKISWKINKKKTKRILNYKCFEATTFFRGNKIIAYFTPEIPISAGPYKFGGLPGLILQLYGEDKNFNIWIATEIIVNYKKNIDFKLNFRIKPISYQEYIKIEDKMNDDLLLKYTKNLPANTIVQEVKLPRQTIEKTYEWEKN